MSSSQLWSSSKRVGREKLRHWQGASWFQGPEFAQGWVRWSVGDCSMGEQEGRAAAEGARFQKQSRRAGLVKRCGHLTQ